MVRVFIVDDAPFIRKAISRVLSSDPEVMIVGEASRGEDALQRIPQCRPDLVTLDIDLPGIDGIATLVELRRISPRLPIIMMSALAREGSDITLQALSAGAADYIDKGSLNMMDFRQLSAELVAKVKLWANQSKINRGELEGYNGGRNAETNLEVDWDRYDLCIIGASTGGPAAIERILTSVRSNFPTPIVVVQHMPSGFTRPFAERLDGMSALSVQEAKPAAELAAGKVIIARSGKHLKIGRDLVIRMSSQPVETMHRPSIDVTMFSAACAGHRVAGILLTGMGNDGAEGMFAIHGKGGLTVAEHEDTCIVPGMPRMACQRGGVEHILPLPAIAALFS